MAARPKEPPQGTIATAIASIALATLFAAPAWAAPDRDILCDQGGKATLRVTEVELSATPANTTDELLENHLLKPRAEATTRQVFADSKDDTEAEDTVEDESDDAEVEPVIRSLSDGQVAPFKRQMYRRDI